MASAPAAMYSRWIAPIRSGRLIDQLVEGRALGHAAAEQQRAHGAVEQQRGARKPLGEGAALVRGGLLLSHCVQDCTAERPWTGERRLFHPMEVKAKKPSKHVQLARSWLSVAPDGTRGQFGTFRADQVGRYLHP